MIALERSYSFAASHLYRRPDWSEERNVRTFGKCANLPAHGHNYRLTVRVAGTVDPETGFVVDLPLLDELSRAMADASICGLGQAAPNPIACVIKYFPEELT